MPRAIASHVVNLLAAIRGWNIENAIPWRLSPEMESVIATGYSDFGQIGARSVSQMRRIRGILLQFRLLFSCVPLLGISDEAIQIYYSAFMAGLSPVHAMNIVDGYRQRIRLINDCSSFIEKPRRMLIIQAMSLALYDIDNRSELLSSK